MLFNKKNYKKTIKNYEKDVVLFTFEKQLCQHSCHILRLKKNTKTASVVRNSVFMFTKRFSRSNRIIYWSSLRELLLST